MTKNEIDHSLALAIGYTADRVHIFKCPFYGDKTKVKNLIYPQGGGAPHFGWQNFDHTDPAVIWLIAERFDCFPRRSSVIEPDWWTVLKDGMYTDSNCAATASALAVIQYFESKA